MNEIMIDVNWFDVVPVFLYIRWILAVVGAYLLLDTIFMVGFIDGPKAATCFKFMLGWMAGSGIGLIAFSWIGDANWMFVFAISTVLCFSAIRLVTWLKGLHLSSFLTGKSVKMTK